MICKSRFLMVQYTPQKGEAKQNHQYLIEMLVSIDLEARMEKFFKPTEVLVINGPRL